MDHTSPAPLSENKKESSVPKFLLVLCGIFGIVFALGAVGLLARLFIWKTIDAIGLVIFAVCIVASAICLTVVCGQTPDFFKKELKSRAVHLRDIWKISHIAWLIFYYMLHGFAMLFLIFTIYMGAMYAGHEETVSKMLCFSVLSLFLNYLNLFINPKKIAQGYRHAYEEIDDALEDNAEPSAANKKIVAAIKKGEKMIGESTFY